MMLLQSSIFTPGECVPEYKKRSKKKGKEKEKKRSREEQNHGGAFQSLGDGTVYVNAYTTTTKERDCKEGSVTG